MACLHDDLEKVLQDSNATPMSLPLDFLKAITCNFSTELELGSGGYGVVYKGVLRSGKIIAVKKLFEMRLKHEMFQNEVSNFMGIKHENVVQFVGYCAESRWEAFELPSKSYIMAEVPKRLLCFEYVSNKSLDKHIADGSLDLEWNMRYQIIKGICNGLHFLHEECRIIHLDLKPENILMDSNMTPKIADFGLSRICGEQQSKIVTKNLAGTCGYMAPEYINYGVITKKADIFSLGVIIIEIITGCREYPYFQLDGPHSTTSSCQHFTEKVLRSWWIKFKSTSKYVSIEKYNRQVELCITIALKCVDPDMEKRPTAKNIVKVLSASDQMETREELHLEMQCEDKSLVLGTVVSKELTPQSISEDMFTNEVDGKLGAINKLQDDLSPTVPLWESSTCSQNNSEDMFINEVDGKLGAMKKLQDDLSPTVPLWESSTSSQNNQEAAKEPSEPEEENDKISESETREGSPDMQHTDTASNDLTIPSVTEGMFNGEINGKVVDETASEEFSPTPSLELSTESQSYQEEVKASSETQLTSDTITEVEACEELPLDMQCTDKLVVSTVSKDLAPHSVTEDMLIKKTDGKLVDEAKSDEGLSDLPWQRAGAAAPGLRRRIRVCPLPSNQQAQRHQAPSSPVALVLLREPKIGNHNYPEVAKDSSETQSTHDTTMETEVIPGSSTLLDVCPLELHFLFEPNQLIPCSLDLTNNTDENLVFVLMEKSNDQSCFLCLPLYGIVAPRSKYTLVVTMNKHENLPEERSLDLILQNSTIGSYSSYSDARYICKERFKEADDFRNTVHQVSLKAVCASQGETTFKAVPPLMKIILVEDTDSIHSIDANETDPLIVTGSFGYVHMHNYGLQKSVGSVEASRSQIVSCVKFIAQNRRRWFVAGSSDGFLHVCKYEKKMEKITSFKAHNLAVRSLAVHPTQPYVLSGSREQIKLWDWDQYWRWKCIQTFEGHQGYICGVAFNPEDPNSFASFTDGSNDHTIQIWSVDSSKIKYSLSGHSHSVRCLDFFTRDGQNYLVTGSLDKTAKIWDMQKNECADTLPHRLKRILNIHGRERVEGLACLAGSRRVAVAHNDALSVMELGDEEQGGSEGNSEDSVQSANSEILLDTGVESMHAEKKEKTKKC